MGAVLAFPEPSGPAAVRRGMVWVNGGTFAMGCDASAAVGAPSESTSVEGFWIDLHPVTNREFARFVEETGWITFAEMSESPISTVLPLAQAPGSLVYYAPGTPLASADPGEWRYTHGASWRRPRGPGSSLAGLWEHPVVHIAWLDAQAYACWFGKDLPTEAEWEFAARGDCDPHDLSWRDEVRRRRRVTNGRAFAGPGPRTSRVGERPANGLGLRDMIGNVWEWTRDWATPPCRDRMTPFHPAACCAPTAADAGIPRKVLKGGSFLCGPGWRHCHRPSARLPHPIDTSTSHIGFRCVVRPPPEGD